MVCLARPLGSTKHPGREESSDKLSPSQLLDQREQRRGRAPRKLSVSAAQLLYPSDLRLTTCGGRGFNDASNERHSRWSTGGGKDKGRSAGGRWGRDQTTHYRQPLSFLF